ncbi:MAG: glycosyltransferase family 39 protein [Deltaproteobacteria bacterium]
MLARPATRSALLWGAGSFLLGALLSLAGMLQKPPSLEQRFVETVLVSVGVLLASGGLLALLSSRSVAPEPQPTERSLTTRTLVSAFAPIVILGLALRFVINRAIAGTVPAPHVTLGVVVTALCLGLLWAALRCAERLGIAGFTASWPGVQGAWVSALTLLLYLPTLGAFGMIDCWEPQYSEVAREMLARHDWISLWWGDQGWFWSKPILDFWLEGVSFAWFGLDPSPESMLFGVAAGRVPLPEWAARLPIVACALAGQWVLQRGVAHHFGGRAARLGTLILVTCPYWFLLARQTMVDMPYVAPLTAAFGFLLLAAAAGPEERAGTYRVQLGRRSLGVSGRHLLFLCIGALALVQIFYLLSRHVSLEGEGGHWHLAAHLDRVWQGSPGNCTLPGNAPCALDEVATHTALQPAWSALAWSLCLGVLFWRERQECRLRGLYYLAAWTCVAVSFLAKAAPGLVLPLCTFGAWLVLQGRLGELRQAKLPALVLILSCIAAPWFVQEYARHGSGFFERLFLHDMYQRVFGHVHDTNAGIDTSFRYYVWQLGYGLFPWSGVLAAGTLFCIAHSALPAADARFRSATQLCVAWQLACFGLFSIAGTKFHHYILPLVPAAAVLGGVWLDALWQRGGASRSSALTLGAAVVTALVARDLASSGQMPGAALLLQLFSYEYSRPWPAGLDYRHALAAFGALSALSCLLLGFVLQRPRWRRWVVRGICAAAVGFSGWALSVYLIQVSPHWSQRETVSTYYRARKGPDELLVAYRQNWMGENFYTSNHVATFKSAGKPFEDWIAERRATGARVLFFTTEHASIPRLQRELGSTTEFELLTTPAQNNKFVLARVVL